MPPKPYRYRECPDCSEVFPAGQLFNLYYGAKWRKGYARQRCPECGYRGRTKDFCIVLDERRAAA